MNYCFYYGIVRGRERLLVFFFICEGIEGLIFDGFVFYCIELIDNFVYLIYRINNYNFNEYYLIE